VSRSALTESLAAFCRRAGQPPPALRVFPTSAETDPEAALRLFATRVAPYVLGLFLAVKQYAVLALPLALLIGRPPMTFAGFRRTAVPAVVVAAVVTLPLAVWEPTGFLRAVVELQFYQPFGGLSCLGGSPGRTGSRPSGRGWRSGSRQW
jgi:hypothetical protein